MACNTDLMIKNNTDVNTQSQVLGKRYAPFRILNIKPLMELQTGGKLYINNSKYIVYNFILKELVIHIIFMYEAFIRTLRQKDYVFSLNL